MTEWISAKDRLPGLVGYYLIRFEDGEVKSAWCYVGSDGRSYFIYDSVTHWMPLPPAPTGERK